jgi:hypothetical protein
MEKACKASVNDAVYCTLICYNLHMNNTHKATFFAALATICAAGSATLAADQTINHGLVVLPLVLMGILLFVAGYFSGQARSKK